MKKLRSAFQSAESVVATIALIAFVGAAIWWFIHSVRTSTHDLSAGEVFVGFGYMAGVLLVALLAVLGWRLVALVGGDGSSPRQRRQPRAADDHSIIRTQLAWGSALVMVGAVLGAICLCFVHPSDAVAGPVLALATAVISAGAVLLPAGAASSASGRIQQEQKDSARPAVTTPTVTRDDETTASLAGTVAPNRNDVEAYFEFQGLPDDPDAQPAAAIAQVQPIEHISASDPPQTLQRSLKTLESGKAYRVRLVAKRPTGPVVTSDWATIESDVPERPAAAATPTGNEPGPAEQPGTPDQPPPAP